MKVLVLNNMVPFTWGGAEELTAHLVHNLRACGADAEAMRVPFVWEPAEELIEQMLLCRSLRLSNVDRVIALKFPVYLVPHHARTVWLMHQYRQAYDLWDAGQSNIPDTPRGEEIRRAIAHADVHALATSRRVFTNSSVTQARLKRYNGLDAEVLLPPLNEPELFFGGDDQGYILAAGRVNASKRQPLLVEAMRQLGASARLLIAGPPDTPADARALQTLVAQHGLEQQVRLDLRLLTRGELAAYVNAARAVAYLPYDEDSFGYVTMEACEARKPVITTSDAGGVKQLVRDRETGRVVEPTPQALAEAMRELLEEPARAARLGAAGHAQWRSLDLTWSATIDKLLA